MRLSDENIVWSKNGGGEGNLFFEKLYIYTYMTYTTVEAEAIAAYPVHAVFQNFTKQFRKYLIYKVHIIVTFCPVSTVKNISDEENAWGASNFTCGSSLRCTFYNRP